jgi:hypothetical protein
VRYDTLHYITSNLDKCNSMIENEKYIVIARCMYSIYHPLLHKLSLLEQNIQHWGGRDVRKNVLTWCAIETFPSNLFFSLHLYVNLFISPSSSCSISGYQTSMFRIKNNGLGVRVGPLTSSFIVIRILYYIRKRASTVPVYDIQVRDPVRIVIS